MKFVIEQLSKNSGRLGQLLQPENGKMFKTPLLIQVTKAGSIPYLSREVFDYVSQDMQVLQISMSTIDHMKEAVSYFNGGGFADFVGYKDYPTLLTIRDPCEQMTSGFNDKDVVPLFTRRGKKLLTAKSFLSFVEIIKPDIYQGLCDADTNYDSSKKRTQKSVDRTEIFMNYCYEQHISSPILNKCCLFAPIVGGYNTFIRSQSIKHAKTKGSTVNGGFIFEGFHSYGLTATEVKSDEIMPIMSHCLKELDSDKPIMMPGAYTPLTTVKLIQLGVDLFDSSYAYCAAINFKAVSFCFDVNSNPTATITETPFIDVTDECHNTHHLMQFFSRIRNCIKNDNLQDLIELIEKQGGDKIIEYRIEAMTKVISKAAMDKDFVVSKQ